MQLIDTHTHIYCEEFDEDRDAVIARAIEAGVVHMLLPAIDHETHERQEQLAQSNPQLFSQMMGLHPTSVGDDYEMQLAQVEHLVESNPSKYVAIGEVGLDLYWDTTHFDQQRDALKRQMALAQRHHLPLALHVRNAYDELFDLLAEINSPTYRGVLHCYSGTLEQAHLALEMGWHIGIGGTLTYKKSTLPDIVRRVPQERLLLETDSPYLAPVPQRGKRNESAYVAYMAQFMAQVVDKSADYVAQQTAENAVNLFSLPTSLILRG